MLDLESAIQHCEEVANTNERLCETVHPAMQLSDYGKCAEEHRQLAEWLKELKRLREPNSRRFNQPESEEHVRPDITYKENELYREIEIFSGDTKVGEAEVDIKNKMLSRLSIYEPYQNKGIGTQVVADLTKEYGLTNLWVNADNERAIYVLQEMRI